MLVGSRIASTCKEKAGVSYNFKYRVMHVAFFFVLGILAHANAFEKEIASTAGHSFDFATQLIKDGRVLLEKHNDDNAVLESCFECNTKVP